MSSRATDRTPTQPALPGFQAPRARSDRLFLALVPDTQAGTRIVQCTRQLCSEHGLTGRQLPVERLHVTLYHLGDFAGLPAEIIAAAGSAAAGIAMPPFDVSFERVKSFPRGPGAGKSPCVLYGAEGVATVVAFYQRLGRALNAAGLRCIVDPDYMAHVTLLYDDRIIASRPVDEIGWTVREVVLVHSLIGQSRHLHLARWPLDG